MIQKVRKTIAYWISPELKREKEELVKIAREAQGKADRKFAELVFKMDPFEPIMRQFHGVFSSQYEHPEDNLNPQSQFILKSFGYKVRDDPGFKFITEWIMNTQGNETLKRSTPTPERILYGRAQISGILAFVNEIGRLASLYEEDIEKKQRGDFDGELSVE